MGDSVSEDAEKLEMLRWLDYGLRVRVHETDQEVFGIDTTSDLAMAEEQVRTTPIKTHDKQSILNQPQL